MRHTISENINVLGKFNSGDTVTISLYKISDESVVGLDSNSCNEIGSTGVFKWNSSNITTPPTEFTEYLWIMDNSTYTQYGKIVLGGYPDDIKDETDKIQTVQTQTDKMNFSGDNIRSRTETIAAAAVDSIHDEVIESALTSRQIQTLLLSFIAGETTGGGTTSVVFKNQSGDKSRITMTVDTNGNRSAVVTDVT